MVTVQRVDTPAIVCESAQSRLDPNFLQSPVKHVVVENYYAYLAAAGQRTHRISTKIQIINSSDSGTDQPCKLGSAGQM